MRMPETNISVVALRNHMSEALGRTQFGHERIGITKNGTLSAVLVPVSDYDMLEAIEDASDVAAFDDAKVHDDGSRVDAADLYRELDL